MTRLIGPVSEMQAQSQLQRDADHAGVSLSLLLMPFEVTVFRFPGIKLRVVVC